MSEPSQGMPPLVIVAVVSTSIAYVAGITAAEALGSRLVSFVSLLEVVFAALFAWILLGEALTPLQLLGGALILGGIAAVRAAGSADDIPALAALPTLTAEASHAPPLGETTGPLLGKRVLEPS